MSPRCGAGAGRSLDSDRVVPASALLGVGAFMIPTTTTLRRRSSTLRAAEVVVVSRGSAKAVRKPRKTEGAQRIP